MRSNHLLIGLSLLAAALTLGCGSSSSRGGAASTVAPSTSSAPTSLGSASNAGTTSPVATASAAALSGVHGLLVEVDDGAGGVTIGFAADGQGPARAITNVASVASAGARVGSAVTLDGVEGAQGIEVSALQADEVALFGRLESQQGQVLFVDEAGRAYEPSGATGAQLLLANLDAPLFVSGEVTPSASGGTPALEVSAWRYRVEVGLGARGGLLAYDERLRVLDVEGPSARVSLRAKWRAYAALGQQEPWRAGSAHVDLADEAELDRLVRAADLLSQPSEFPATALVFDIPAVTLYYADQNGERAIKIGFRANLPAEVEALVDRLRALEDELPAVRHLRRGSALARRQAGISLSRSEASYQQLWSDLNALGQDPAPSVDFQGGELALGAFMGSGSSGRSVEIRSVERVGEDLYVEIERRRPLPGQPVTLMLTSPYHLTAIQTAGRKGRLFVDGKPYSIQSRLLRPGLGTLKPIPRPGLVPGLRPQLPQPQPRPLPPLRPQPRPLPIKAVLGVQPGAAAFDASVAPAPR